MAAFVAKVDFGWRDDKTNGGVIAPQKRATVDLERAIKPQDASVEPDRGVEVGKQKQTV
jgi:hypothetical protein